jgi:cell division transport system permease protein
MYTNLKRICKFACNDFFRNKGISIAAIFILIVTTMLVTGIYFFQGISHYLILEVQDKIDVTAYFKQEVPQEDILKAKDEILKLSESITDVQYVSKEQALQNFTKKHQGNEVLSGALQEVGGDPFLPSLNIKTNGDASQYEEIATLLQNSSFSQSLDSVDFSQKKDTMERIFKTTSSINMTGIILGIIFVLVAILVVYNTIRLAVENSKEEINTMKIVGASDWFVRGPFIVQGAIYGAISFISCFLLTIIFAYFLSSKLDIVLPGFNIFHFFLSNFFVFVLIQLGFGVLLGVATSYMVVKKYLQD